MKGQRTGVADLPLHRGEVARWLFHRMALLAREIATIVVGELKRLKPLHCLLVTTFSWRTSRQSAST